MMPDELTVAIQEAIARARARCPACRIDALACHICNPDPWPESRHTCDGDLAIAKRLARAVLATQPHLHEYEHVNSPCDPSAVMEVSSGCPRCCCEAEIERQFALREGSERGKE